MDGALARPEIRGDFRIKGGVIGKLSYDRALIYFRGFPPYLALYDSKILKGRTTLRLNGALDLSLKNMFHGVEIRAADRLVIWRGWEISKAPGGDFEIDRVLSRFPMLSLKGGQGPSDSPDAQGLEDGEELYAGIGPKIKF